MTEFWAEVEIELLPTALGGRSTPLDLCNDHPGTYRSHLRVVGGSGVLLAVAFMDGPDSPILPGTNTHTTVKALYEPGVWYAELKEGTAFEILEGPHVVGRGRVLRV